jgi:hypothetical protein
MCDSTITVQCAALRVKKSVLPSGENVGAPSLAGPEISPGAKIFGSGREVVPASWVEEATAAVVESDARSKLRTRGVGRHILKLRRLKVDQV